VPFRNGALWLILFLMAVELCAPPATPFTVATRPTAAPAPGAPWLSLIVPTYNESSNIAPFLADLRAALDEAAISYEVIVVDDDSPDGTSDLAADIAAKWPNLRIVRRASERGLASAVVRGWQAARGEVLGTINADFQHPPEMIPEMLRRMEGADLTVATRYAADGSVGAFPLHRRILSTSARQVGAAFAPGIFGRVSDPLSGCYLFRRHTIENIELQPAGFKTLIEILARGRVQKIAECGYTMRKRRSGQSNVRLRDWMEYFGQLRRLRNASRRRSL